MGGETVRLLGQINLLGVLRLRQSTLAMTAGSDLLQCTNCMHASCAYKVKQSLTELSVRLQRQTFTRVVSPQLENFHS